jgi:hypothetical protein
MLAACRLAGLSALEAHYADDNAQAQSGVEEQYERYTRGRDSARKRPWTALAGRPVGWDANQGR